MVGGEPIVPDETPSETSNPLDKELSGEIHKKSPGEPTGEPIGEPSDDFVILDVHILRNLKKYGVIDEMPKSLSKKKYLEIETKMKEFAETIGIPVDELDLLLWSEETGFIFK